jgi:hypothetical protein
LPVEHFQTGDEEEVDDLGSVVGFVDGDHAARRRSERSRSLGATVQIVIVVPSQVRRQAFGDADYRL